MKSQIISAVLISGIEAQRGMMERPEQDDPERRYSQLKDMMAFYNSEFDERKYWTYGCQCLMLGDRPMSDPGVGPPIDPLDTVCKAYKDCLKCAREEHGEMCIGEFVRYKYGGKKRGEIICRDDPNDGPDEACKRKICECDALFAREHGAVTHVFNKDYHLFWSTLPGGWEPKENCPRGGGGPYIPKCCGTPTSPQVLYNAASKKCCDGHVKQEC